MCSPDPDSENGEVDFSRLRDCGSPKCPLSKKYDEKTYGGMFGPGLHSNDIAQEELTLHSKASHSTASATSTSAKKKSGPNTTSSKSEDSSSDTVSLASAISSSSAKRKGTSKKNPVGKR